MLFVGTDVGGTFTDVVIFDGESRKSLEVLKVPTNPKHPESAILEALERSEEHTSELQSHSDLVCRLLLEKKKRLRLLDDPDCAHHVLHQLRRRHRQGAARRLRPASRRGCDGPWRQRMGDVPTAAAATHRA